jgi:ABC-type molybdate transport system substrate-binding protein
MAMLFSASAARAADPVVVYAAGSLRAALTDIGREFQAQSDTSVQFEFGASGLLKDRIVAGAPAQVFASANTEHPRALAQAGKAEQEMVFARNQLCALLRPTIKASPAELLTVMLDDHIKLGTSTPKADPSGDYAWEVFRKAEALRPGSFGKLSAKALQLTGGPNSPAPPADGSLYAMLVAEGHADVFLTYCTNAALAIKESPQLKVVELPPELAVGAEYGVTVINGAPATARRFVDFLRGPQGQAVLRSYGFR